MYILLLIFSLILGTHCGDYIFSVPSVLVQHTRSPHFDTLVGAIFVNGTGVVQPVSYTKLLGDHGGSNPAPFSPDHFQVEFSASDDAEIQIGISLLNKGGAGGGDTTRKSLHKIII